jgi:uncharacterized protein YvpB
MSKPNPIAIISLCVVAVSILAFTINDELQNRKASGKATSVISSKPGAGITPFLTSNPPHGKPGHRHDLPDGAPLPVDVPQQASTTNNLSLNNSLIQPSGSNDAGPLNPEHGKPGHRCDIAVGAPLNSAAPKPITEVASTAYAASGKNPAHGQPGHRCDIAVGAPLNSAPTTSANSIVAAKASTPNSSQVTATGLNPAHGQPGHRCDIAVGAPFNSPKNSTIATTAPKSMVPNYSFSPIQDSTKTATPQFEYDSAGAALNPAHGQPGHDCTIAVGKPLKK